MMTHEKLLIMNVITGLGCICIGRLIPNDVLPAFFLVMIQIALMGLLFVDWLHSRHGGKRKNDDI